MLFLAILFSCTLTICYGQNDTVDEYVRLIDIYKENALHWVYPQNSYSYLIPKPEINDNASLFYDFIICGAGASGTVLASRLSEVSDWNVLLIEAGEYENEITDIPGMADYLRTTNFNWGYNVYPQGKLFNGFIDNAMITPRGKAIGGSSVINAMIYARGNKADFDKWANETSEDWSYESILKYFKKSENATFPNASITYHGIGGDLNVEYSRVFDEIGQAYLDAQESQGRKILDYNGENQLGFSTIQMTEINGRRDSGGKAFVRPAFNRSNLHITTNALITKILIDKFTKTAYGVKYVRNGQEHVALATKEVILSAGTLQTPQLLMLSGIGPWEELRKFDIDFIQNLKVGENLWDHLIYDTQSYSLNYTYVNLNERTQVEEYLQGRGDLTSPDNTQCIGYVKVLNDTDDNQVPDVEHVLHTSNPVPQPYQLYKNLHRYTYETYEYVLKPTENQSQLSIHSVLLHPRSRGAVHLKSASPFDFPIVDPKYFSSHRDVEILIRAIEDAHRTTQTDPLQKYDASPIKVRHPACKDFDWGTHEYWACMVVNLSETIHHFGGTCKMGRESDSNAVVDPRLKVYGIKNLRVIDCSVIPVTISGHTMSTAYMLAEKGSDLIKEDHGIQISN